MEAYPSAAEMRTAARVIRWVKKQAESQIADFPWYKRLFESYPKNYLRLMVFNLEEAADEIDNRGHAPEDKTADRR